MDRDDVLARAAANCAAAYLAPARAMRKPWRKWEDLWASDLGLPVTLPPNNATLLLPLAEERAQDVAARVDAFFATGAGGGYELWSFWPTPDLRPFGFEVYRCPCMVRPGGGSPPPRPPELEISEVRDPAALREVEEILIGCFEIKGSEPGTLYDERVFDSGWRVWIGRVAGRGVSTSAAYVSDGFVGVYAVGTVADARGRGYGEALTWAATAADPNLPATLQASELGRPVYERMGYEIVAECTVWCREERLPRSSFRSNDP